MLRVALALGPAVAGGCVVAALFGVAAEVVFGAAGAAGVVVAVGFWADPAAYPSAATGVFELGVGGAIDAADDDGVGGVGVAASAEG